MGICAYVHSIAGPSTCKMLCVLKAGTEGAPNGGFRQGLLSAIVATEDDLGLRAYLLPSAGDQPNQLIYATVMCFNA